MNNEELLCAQLIQCIMVMREGVNILQQGGDAQAVIDLLTVARCKVVEPEAIERFRAGEWQAAKQEAARLQGQVTELTNSLAEEIDKNDLLKTFAVQDDISYRSLEGELETMQRDLSNAVEAWQAAEQRVKNREESRAQLQKNLAETLIQLETTQCALVVERAKNDFPNSPLEEARQTIVQLKDDLMEKEVLLNEARQVLGTTEDDFRLVRNTLSSLLQNLASR